MCLWLRLWLWLCLRGEGGGECVIDSSSGFWVGCWCTERVGCMWYQPVVRRVGS